MPINKNDDQVSNDATKDLPAKDSSEDTNHDDAADQEILRVAKERFNIAVEAEATNRKDEIDDQRFMIGEQWPIDIKNSRAADSRPCLTINRIPQFVRQITNDQRQNRPSIKINPVDDKATIDTAKVLQGIIRHIEYNSHSDIAVDTAFEHAVQSGLGYLRVTTEFSHPTSFQQEIKIKRIKDRFSVYLDPYYQEPDGSDAQWGFVFEDMSKDEFKAQYPKAKLSSMSDWESLGNIGSDWLKKESVRVAEYYYKIYKEVDLVQLSDGTVLNKKHFNKIDLPDGVTVVSERTTLKPKIKWCKFNGFEILERTNVPGQWIPIIPVIGEENLVEGRRVLSGIIRHAKDPQRMYNYWASSETETIALAPRAPFIGYEGQFEGYEDKWKTANTKNHAYLEVRKVTIAGSPAPLPTRNVYEPPVQAITQARAQSADDLKATTGIYDATLGNRSNEQSGVAIQRRNAQAQTSNFHFMDNLSRSLRHTGRILVKWIPKVYDMPQAVRVIGDDGEVTMVTINKVFNEDGKEKSHFLNHGEYDVTVDTGPSFQTKRQEAVASMIDFTKAVPQYTQIIGDLLVRSMDWPGAKEMADRIKKSLPPNLLDDDKDQQPLPPQVQQQMQQMQQMIKMLSKEVEENSEIIKTKRMELESKERISLMEQETQLKVEILKHDAKDAQLIFSTEIDHINQRLSLLNFDQPVGNGSGGQPLNGQPPENPMQPNQPQQQPQPSGGHEPAAMGAPQ